MSQKGRLLLPTPGGSSRPGWRHGERQLQGAAAYWQSRPGAGAVEGLLYRISPEPDYSSGSSRSTSKHSPNWGGELEVIASVATALAVASRSHRTPFSASADFEHGPCDAAIAANADPDGRLVLPVSP